MAYKVIIVFLISACQLTVFGNSTQEQVVLTDAASVHAGIEIYEGPQTCVKCHEKEALDMFGSVHYQWNGETPNVTNISGIAGKKGSAFNTYCGAVNTTRRVVCWSCHVGYGKEVTDIPNVEQINNIDCLMCHQDQYKRKFVPTIPTGDFNQDFFVNFDDYTYLSQQWGGADLTSSIPDLTHDGTLDPNDLEVFCRHWLQQGGGEMLTYTGFDGIERTWTLPYEGGGELTVVADVDNMTMTPLEAARTVHMPTRTSCLRCHATAGGGNNNKRGNLSTLSADPDYQVDVHMSSTGANLNCQDCHETVDHRVLGRGIDLRVNDRPERMTCDNGSCHTSTPHSQDRLNKHTSRVACQTCHISTYGKVIATETHRDWTEPHWAQGLYGGQGGFKPTEYKENDLVPTYFWYDGTSYVYKLGDTAVMRPDGLYETASPNGSVTSTNAKIYPIKEHTTTTAIHEGTAQFIPFNVSQYFFTGELDLAVADGLDELGLSGDWSVVQAHASQSINHGVEPADNALDCGDCHESLFLSDFFDGGPVRMDLQGQLGYGAQTGQASPCLTCHLESPAEMDFLDLHFKHVNQEGITCRICHDFDRPERNLSDCTECHQSPFVLPVQNGL